MKALVTGGAGYVGSHMVKTLLDAGHQVVVVDDLSTGHHDSVPPDRVAFVEGDVADAHAMSNVLRAHHVEAVFHFAAKIRVEQSVSEPRLYWRGNVIATLGLLDAVIDAGNIQAFVQSSTAAVYGTPETTPITEDAALRPINPYGETKRTFEGALRWYGGAYGLRAVSLRYFNVAGATETLGEDHDPETHLIPNVLAAAAGERDLTVFGDDYPTPDGTCIRDYIHVADLAAAHLLAIEATTPGDPRTDDYLACNLGIGGGFSVREVIAAAERAVGRPIPFTMGIRRAGDPPILVASAARAGEVLGWRPRYTSLDDMVGSAWAWRQQHPGGYPD